MKAILFSLTIAVLLWSLAGASLVQAQGAGYTGLIAPEPKANTAFSPEPEISVYGGLLVPAPRKREYTSRKKQPIGYSGLIPGRAKKRSVQQEGSLQMTRIPGNVPQIKPRSSDDLKSMAQIYGQNSSDRLLPDVLRKPKRLSKKTAYLLAGPRARIKGKLPMVYMIEQKIGKLMSWVGDKNLSPEAQIENARKAYKELAPFAEGLRHKKKVPDDIFRQMGLSETFIEEKKTGTSIALAQLDETLRKLKSYK